MKIDEHVETFNVLPTADTIYFLLGKCTVILRILFHINRGGKTQILQIITHKNVPD